MLLESWKNILDNIYIKVHLSDWFKVEWFYIAEAHETKFV